MLEIVSSIFTIIILLFVTIKGYLLIARKSEKHTKKEIWAVAKFELPIFIATFTVCSGFQEQVTGYKIYMYFLIILYAIIEGVDNYKNYKTIKNAV